MVVSVTLQLEDYLYKRRDRRYVLLLEIGVGFKYEFIGPGVIDHRCKIPYAPV